MKINILCKDFSFPNIRSFLYPFILYNSFFKNNGYHFKFISQNDINKCDILFVESNYLSSFLGNDNFSIKKKTEYWRRYTKKIIYFDTSDSTSILHPFILDHVDLYCKSQILKDKNLYKKKFYGNRIFTEFCHKNYKISDNEVSYSNPIKCKKNLQKIRVFWNSSIMNYSLTGKLASQVYQMIPINNLIFFPSKKKFKKTRDIFFNMNLEYRRETVAWHRKTAIKKLFNKTKIKKINFFKYYKNLSLSKICISPFGWGEINYRDYESFIYGAILLKPKMDHVSTWPDLYNKKNYISYDWSCKDLKVIAEKVIDEYKYYKNVASNAQNYYLSFLNSKNLNEIFLNRIKLLIND